MDKQERERKSGDESFHARSVEEVLGQLDVTAGQGLAEGEVRKRRGHYGPNELEEEVTPSPYLILLIRDRGTSVRHNDVIANKWMWGAWALCLVLLLAAVYWAPLAKVLQTIPPGVEGWAVIFALSFIPAVLGAFLPGIRFYSAKTLHPGKQKND